MELILGLIIFVATDLWILKKLDELELFEYETVYCRGDVRATGGMITYASDIEEMRTSLSNRSSKF